MNILITVLLIIGMFCLNISIPNNDKKMNFSISLITNIIVIILLWTKIF